MASIKKRGKKEIYYAQFYDENGKQKRVCLDTTIRKKAKLEKNKIESALF